MITLLFSQGGFGATAFDCSLRGAECKEQLDSIPGVHTAAARDIFAEIGTDMSRFGSATQLTTWAGIAPGNNENAGKRRRGRSRKGNRSLRRILVQCAWTEKSGPKDRPV